MSDLATKLDFLFTYQAWVAEKNTGTPDVSANAYGEHLKAIAAVEALGEIADIINNPAGSASDALSEIESIVRRSEEQA